MEERVRRREKRKLSWVKLENTPDGRVVKEL